MDKISLCKLYNNLSYAVLDKTQEYTSTTFVIRL